MRVAEEQIAKLMMLCGCLHDIAEKTKDSIAQKQLLDVSDKLQKIVEKINDEA